MRQTFILKKQLESLVFSESLDLEQVAQVHAQWIAAKTEEDHRAAQANAEYQAKQAAENDRRLEREQHLGSLNLSKQALLSLAGLDGSDPRRYTKDFLIELIASNHTALPNSRSTS